MSNEAGKGDRQRPTDHEAFSKAWETIFGNKPSPGTLEQYDKLKLNAPRPEQLTPQGATGACGYPFCKCVTKCEEL